MGVQQLADGDDAFVPPEFPVFVPAPGCKLRLPGWQAALGAGAFARRRPAEEIVFHSADATGVIRGVASCRLWSVEGIHQLAQFTLFNALFLPPAGSDSGSAFRPDRAVTGSGSRDATRYEHALDDERWRDSTWFVDDLPVPARVWSFDGLSAGHISDPSAVETLAGPWTGGPAVALLAVAREVDLDDLRWCRLSRDHGFGFDPFRGHSLREVQVDPPLGLPFLSEEALTRFRTLGA